MSAAGDMLRAHLGDAHSPGRRLMMALERGDAGPADLAVLLRHVLRTGNLTGAAWAQGLHLPLELALDPHALSRADVELLREGGLRAQARAWKPRWLGGVHEPGQAALNQESRRTAELVDADPFLETFTGERSYSNAAQRDAVRAAILAPPGATLVVNLPTGAGKTLVAVAAAQARAQGIDRNSRGVSVVIVPTISLCLDQSARLVARGHPEAAYCSATRDEVRSAIWQRVMQGEQGIVFVSPEAFCGSLSLALRRAAVAGRLRLIAIDEAHMVEAWGADFRPAFQGMAGVRRGLLEACATAGHPLPLTLLMTATLTRESFTRLRALFSQPGPFEHVSAVQVRPEPEWWMKTFESEELRQDAVTDALFHLPRPAILYTTRPADAEAWRERLQDVGFRRFDVFTGQTDNDQRRDVMDRWARGEELDLVVATAAFGLGIDRSDVRSVIHACIPESLDRLYQEVGRGGRDGCASVSLVCIGPDDRRLAGNLAGDTIISVERGHRRWFSTFHSPVLPPTYLGRHADGKSRFRVRIDVPPSADEKDIDMQGRQHEAWSVRTLLLMARAGLIRLSSEAPEERTASDRSDPAGADDEGRAPPTRVVEILDESHLDLATWESRVEPERARAAEDTRAGLALLDRYLGGSECVGDLLGELYGMPEEGVEVSLTCGCCPGCRAAAGNRRPSPLLTTHAPVWRPRLEIAPDLREVLGDKPFAAVAYPESATTREGRPRDPLRELLAGLATRGIVNFIVGPNVRADAHQRLARHAVLLHDERDLVHRFTELEPLLAARPCAWFPDPRGPHSGPWRRVLEAFVREHPDLPFVAVVPENLADLARPERAFTATRNFLTLDGWRRRFYE